MKHLKMLGLAAIAALGLMAFAGAGTAPATTLSTDAAGTMKYATDTEIHVTLKSGTSSVFEKTNGDQLITCAATTVRTVVGNATGTWVFGENTAVTQTNCSQRIEPLPLAAEKSCRVKAETKAKLSANTLKPHWESSRVALCFARAPVAGQLPL